MKPDKPDKQAAGVRIKIKLIKDNIIIKDKEINRCQNLKMILRKANITAFHRG